MIRVQDLCKSFGSHRAVDHVSFEIETGEIVGFIGPNGAGKSTTMRMLTGYLASDRGRAEVLGFRCLAPSARGAAPHRLPAGVEPALRRHARAPFLRFVAEVRGIPRRERAAAVERAIELCALQEVARKRIRECSKGYKQRVGLAQAVIHSPKVLILDEPTEGLDPNQRVVMRDLIQGFAKQGATVILSTHILPEVELTCPRALMISRGRIVADGAPKKISGPLGTLEQAFRQITQTKE
ncbi:MAG: ATP-binding cassette domain-containing protein [Planctomycetes bacterium]|nr:ATP-binding cassette domain-containing protein [Planctomycetota bacterium]